MNFWDVTTSVNVSIIQSMLVQIHKPIGGQLCSSRLDDSPGVAAGFEVLSNKLLTKDLIFFR